MQDPKDAEELRSWQAGEGPWTSGCERAILLAVKILRKSLQKEGGEKIEKPENDQH